MRLLVLVSAICIAASAACTALPKLDTSTNTLPVIEYPHVKRPNLVVSDIPRALTIYQDILGLEASDITTSSEDSYAYPVFNIPAGARIRGVTLHEPGEQRVLALTELPDLNLERPSSSPHLSTTVIGVNNLSEKIQKIEFLGLKTTTPKFDSGPDFNFVEQAFVDFDGHLIVLYEASPNER